MIRIVGEALVDLVIQPGGEVSAALGGAPYNTARAVARLGGDVEFAGVLSDDRFGTMLADQLVSDGVDIGRAPRTGLPTTLAAAELDDSGSASYRFYIEGTSAPALAAADLDELPAADVVFTGGLGLVLEPMASTVERAVAAADDSTTVVVDVNCRPNVIADRSAYLARVDRMLARVDVVKVSDEDLAFLRPGATVDEAVASFLDLGVAAVLVTQGSKATTIHTATGSGAIAVAASAREVVDTIGAGDTFGGGFLVAAAEAGLDRIRLRAGGAFPDLARAVVAANAAAARVVTRRGADPPWRHELAPEWGT